GAANRSRRVPAQARIDHQFDVGAKPLARCAHMRDVALFALAHRAPAELNGFVTLLDEIAADAFGLLGGVAEEDGRVGAKLLAKAAAEQLIDWPLDRLADDVPQRDLDAGHRLDDRPLPAEKDRP